MKLEEHPLFSERCLYPLFAPMPAPMIHYLLHHISELHTDWTDARIISYTLSEILRHRSSVWSFLHPLVQTEQLTKQRLKQILERQIAKRKKPFPERTLGDWKERGWLRYDSFGHPNPDSAGALCILYLVGEPDLISLPGTLAEHEPHFWCYRMDAVPLQEGITWKTSTLCGMNATHQNVERKQDTSILPSLQRDEIATSSRLVGETSPDLASFATHLTASLLPCPVPLPSDLRSTSVLYVPWATWHLGWKRIAPFLAIRFAFIEQWRYDDTPFLWRISANELDAWDSVIASKLLEEEERTTLFSASQMTIDQINKHRVHDASNFVLSSLACQLWEKLYPIFTEESVTQTVLHYIEKGRST